MAGALVDIVLNVGLLAVSVADIAHRVDQQSKAEQKALGVGQRRAPFSQLAPITPHSRAVLTSSSNMKFGNDCERLVNIAFQTSQTFPSLMGTYADITQYLQKELAKHYPDEHFHIVIGNNGDFDFSIGDGEYFAQIEQDRYRVVIFATKRDVSTKSDTHDANSQMKLLWK